MPVTILLTYSGTPQDLFDREYYCSKHLPMVEAAWKPHGLISLRAFFPAPGPDAPGTVALCECVFEDEAAVDAAFSSPETQGLVADLANFTDLALSRSRMIAFPL